MADYFSAMLAIIASIVFGVNLLRKKYKNAITKVEVILLQVIHSVVAQQLRHYFKFSRTWQTPHPLSLE